MLKARRIFFLACGFLCVVLGLAGILIPVLPTTPFLLAAAFFFAHSSERVLRWLLENRWFGRYIRNYREGKGMPAREKAITLGLLWLTIGTSVVFIAQATWLRVLLVVVALGVTAHLLRIRTCPAERPAALPDPE